MIAELLTKLYESIKKTSLDKIDDAIDIYNALDREEFLRLLESFKRNEISGYLEYIYKKAIDVINPLCKIHVMPDLPTEPQKHKRSYILCNGDGDKKLYYIKFDGTIEEVPFTQKLELLEKYLNQTPKEGDEPWLLDGKQIDELITANSGHTPENYLVAPYFTNLTPETLDAPEAPFANFEDEPDNISQIKKLFNALYYARLTFRDLEKVNIRDISNNYEDLQLLISRTVETAYEASYLATHLDVDIKALFHDELEMLLPYLGQIQNYAKSQATDLKGFIDKSRKNIKNASYVTIELDVNLLELAKEDFDLIQLHLAHIEQFAENRTESLDELIRKAKREGQLKLKLGINLKEVSSENQDFIQLHLTPIEKLVKITVTEIPLAYKVGDIAGIAVDHLQPLGGEIDYNFLTKFGASLPGYINQLTQYINEYSSQIKKNQPGLNQVKLDELRNAALNLLNDLEKLQGNNMFISLKFLNYIHIIRNIITIAMSTVEQFGELNESSQDLVRDKLAQLKYQVLPTLFGLVDKIEVNSMVKAGTLSEPLMKQVKELYKALLYFPQKAIDFKAKGEELLSIEDSRFVELRLELAYKRNSAANIALYKNQKMQQALNIFFTILEQEKYKNQRLHELPDEVKVQLISAYKVFSPLMVKLNVEFNNLIVASLSENVESWWSFFGKPFRRITGALPADHVSHVLQKKAALQSLITKNQNSQLFHIKLNGDLVNFVHQDSKLVLFPYVATTSTYVLDESIPLATHLANNDLHLMPKLPDDLDEYKRSYILCNHESGPKLYYIRVNKTEENGEDEEVTVAEEVTIKRKRPFEEELNKITGCDLHLMSELPTNLKRYKNSYILCNKNDVHRLHYVNEDGTAEAVTIADMARFKNVLETIPKPAGEPWHLGAYDTMRLIIANGGHTRKPWSLSTSETVKLITENGGLTCMTLKNGDLSPTFNKAGNNIKLQQPEEQLNTELALELCQWYRTKHNKFEVVQKEYAEFIELLKTHKINGSILNIFSLDNKLKEQLRKSYNVFQSYFIDAVPKEHKEWALKFDKYLVGILSNRPIDLTNAPTIDTLLDLHEHTERHFSHFYLKLHKKNQQYFMLAEQNFARENAASDFKKHENKDPRARYLLPTTDISRSIHEFRKDLLALVQLFNAPMQKELTLKKEKGIPFPEMENSKDANIHLKQCQQVRAIKDIYNTLYHLEEIVRQLEELKDYDLDTNLALKKIKKGLYVYHLVRAYAHVNTMITISKRLASDPYYGLMTKELMYKAQRIYAVIKEQSGAYQTGPEQILTGENPVQYSALWYALNAFYISPKHIRALNNTQYLTTEELNDLHEHAKKATLTIEGFINNSDSYFKLFLQTPKMLSLYKELQQKFNEFTTTTHDAVLGNLDTIRSAILTPMIMEADNWEDKLGLAPGSFSDPLRKILDEYYKGLLHPLKLHSKKHIALVCDLEPLTQRKGLLDKEFTKSDQKIRKHKQTLNLIDDLYKQMQEYKALTNRSFWKGQAPAEEIALKKQEIQTTYKNALPIFTKLKSKKKIIVDTSVYDSEHIFDDFCNEVLKEYEPHFTEIESMVSATHHYYTGLISTFDMKIEVIREKKDHLEEVQHLQEQEHKEFIESYTAEAFRKHLRALCNRHNGLQRAGEEYRQALEEELLRHRAKIINDSKTADDINLTINNLLKEKIAAFEKKNFAKYHQLDLVFDALGKFRTYFTDCTEKKQSLFEDNDTLSKKSLLINELEQIATRRDLPISARIDKIKNKVEDPNFTRVILAHREPDVLSFAYLKMCIFFILEALHLFTPTRKKLLNNIEFAAKNQPQIRTLAPRFGLFHHPEDINEKKGLIEKEEPKPPYSAVL